MALTAGADPGSSNREGVGGGAKDYVHAAHIPTAKRKRPEGYPGPVWRLRALEALGF